MRARFAASALLAITALPIAAQPPATPVQVDAVRVATSAQTLPIVARVVAPESGPIAARTNGTVTEFKVDVGDRVAAGDVIAVLARKIQRTQLETAKANLKRAEAQARLASLQLERMAQLKDSSAFEESLYDQREAELGTAEADLRLARVNLAAAETDYGWGTIRAPFPGVITARHTNLGAFVNRGQQVVSMVNTAAFEVEADVPADKLRGIAPGTAVTVRVMGETVPGTVRAIVPLDNPGTRTRPVRVKPEFGNTLARLAENTSADVLIPVGSTRDVLTVHKDAINRRGDSTSVYVVEDGKAAVRPVQLGDAVGSRLAVLSGLEAGDLVVTRGNERLQPGQAVAFEQPQG
ncbi:efflux RND transporter periplasmic adaptor subunit [bacterium]|nr:efflux RND transporter periplasmic adaptor subunit [bacterium]